MEKKVTKVLLVDDTQLFLELEKSCFNRQDCEVFTATDGIAALKVAGEERPDLVMLDLYIPEMDGIKVLENIRQQDELNDTKVIVSGTGGKEEDIDKCRELGCDAHLLRPITKNKMIETAARVLNIPLRVDARVEVEMEVYSDPKHKKYFGLSRDISAGGIYVMSEKKFKPGSRVHLSFSLPHQEGVFSLESRSVRVVNLPPRQGKPFYGLAFQYLKLKASERKKIEAFVEEKAGK